MTTHQATTTPTRAGEQPATTEISSEATGRALGYASIGCVPCTAPGDGREGRWAGTGKLECGLHAA